MQISQISNQTQSPFFLNLDGYEGPIDMLLSLAREQKVDLTRIAILPLAEQYLKFIEEAQILDLEIAADYLVMAAWLAYLKSRLILPDPDPEEVGEAVNMTDALRFQLQRLEAMQTASKHLMKLPKLNSYRLTRGMPDYFSISDKVTFTANLYDLLRAYGNIRSVESTSKLTVVGTKLYSVQDAVERLRKIIPSIPDWSDLREFLPNNCRNEPHHSSGITAYFCAALELAKDGIIQIKQNAKFSPILLRQKRKLND